MTPQQFVNKWARTVLGEKQSAQAHFLDVCRLVGVDMPGGKGMTPSGDAFVFEQALKQSTGHGFADVWYENHFAIEYKSPDKYRDLKAAYEQLQRYRENLNNPPLLVVTDINRWEIHTNFPNTQKRVYAFQHSQIASDPQVMSWLRDMFHAPERLHPGRNTEQVTQEAAKAFQLIAENMREWQTAPQRIAFFLTKLVFCLFAEDIGLLPNADNSPDGIFTHIIKRCRGKPAALRQNVQNLFNAMNRGDYFYTHKIDYFNGSLFKVVTVEDLSLEAIDALAAAAELNWESIEPSIFGTLFERSLDPRKRSQLGSHYTSREDILLIVEPVLMQPLRYQWDTIQLQAQPIRQRYDRATTGRARANARGQLLELRETMLKQIRATTVLDPACGSGNFLYVSLQMLMDLEKEVIQHPLWAGLQMASREVHPRQMYGIEIDPIAHALASIVVWIGYIQWRIKNGYGREFSEPILEELEDNIVCKDAILPPTTNPPQSPQSFGGKAAVASSDCRGDSVNRPQDATVDWPRVDVIVGNPPFLGNKKMQHELGEDYYWRLVEHYSGRIPGGVDLVCYWFELARQHIDAGKAKRAGLLATNSIRGGLNRQVLSRIKDAGNIFMAWSDRNWILDGAAVRVSMVGFDNGDETAIRLNGLPVETINSDLTADVDVTAAKVLPENLLVSFQGVIKRGSFDIDASLAKSMIASDPKNKEVLKPIHNAIDITRRPRNKWIIDFGVNTPIEVAKEFVLPFAHVQEHVKPQREKVRQEKSRRQWWLHESSRPIMRSALEPLTRFIVTPIVSRHRVFVWMGREILPDKRIYTFARDDDYFFGVLHSSVHEIWTLRTCTWHGKGNDPRYTNTTTFETFPFPWPPGSEDTSHPAHAAISASAKQLHEERLAWLNPNPPQSPQRIGGKPVELKDRTLTNLYNALQVYRGQSGIKVKPDAGDFAPRLDALHRALDEAVCDAYGWGYEVLEDEEEILRRLLELNLGRTTDS